MSHGRNFNVYELANIVADQNPAIALEAAFQLLDIDKKSYANAVIECNKFMSLVYPNASVVPNSVFSAVSSSSAMVDRVESLRHNK